MKGTMRNATLIALAIVSGAGAYVGDWNSYTPLYEIRAFTEAKGFLFAGTGGGIRKLNPATQAEAAYNNKKGLRDVGITAMASSPEGDVFAASELGFLYRYDWGQDQWEVLEAGYKGAGWHMNRRAMLYRSGYLVIGSDKGLSFYNVRKRVAEANVTKLETVSGMSVNSLLFRGDTLFVGTNLGIYRAVLHLDRLLTDPQINIFNPAIWTNVVKGGLYYDPALGSNALVDSTTVGADTGLHLPPEANQDHAHGVLYYGSAGIASDYNGVVLDDPPARISRYRSTFSVEGRSYPNPLGVEVIDRVGSHWYTGRINDMFEFFPGDSARFYALVNPQSLPYLQIASVRANRFGVFAWAAPKIYKFSGPQWDSAAVFDVSDDSQEWLRRGLRSLDVLGPDEFILGTWGSGIRYRRGNETIRFDALNSCLESAVTADPNYPAIFAMTAYKGKGYFFSVFVDKENYSLAYFDRATRKLTCSRPDDGRGQQARDVKVVGDTMLAIVTERGVDAYRIRDAGGQVSLEPGNLVASLPTSSVPTQAGNVDVFGNFWITTEGSDLLYVPDLANHPDSAKAYRTLDGFSGVSCKNLERDPSGHLWTGCTEGGVFEVTPGRDSSLHSFRKYGLNDGLLSEAVFNLSVNPDNGDIWVTTDKGISRYESPSRPTRPNLSEVKAYPNPFLPKHRVVVFDNLSAGSEVEVLTQSGEVVFRRTLSKGGLGDQIQWDGRNPSGKRVTEGVYFYVVKSSRETKHGKLIVAR